MADVLSPSIKPRPAASQSPYSQPQKSFTEAVNSFKQEGDMSYKGESYAQSLQRYQQKYGSAGGGGGGSPSISSPSAAPPPEQSQPGDVITVTKAPVSWYYVRDPNTGGFTWSSTRPDYMVFGWNYLGMVTGMGTTTTITRQPDNSPGARVFRAITTPTQADYENWVFSHPGGKAPGFGKTLSLESGPSLTKTGIGLDYGKETSPAPSMKTSEFTFLPGLSFSLTHASAMPVFSAPDWLNPIPGWAEKTAAKVSRGVPTEMGEPLSRERVSFTLGNILSGTVFGAIGTLSLGSRVATGDTAASREAVISLPAMAALKIQSFDTAFSGKPLKASETAASLQITGVLIGAKAVPVLEAIKAPKTTFSYKVVYGLGIEEASFYERGQVVQVSKLTPFTSVVESKTPPVPGESTAGSFFKVSKTQGVFDLQGAKSPSLFIESSVKRGTASFSTQDVAPEFFKEGVDVNKIFSRASGQKIIKPAGYSLYKPQSAGVLELKPIERVTESRLLSRKEVFSLIPEKAISWESKSQTRVFFLNAIYLPSKTEGMMSIKGFRAVEFSKASYEAPTTDFRLTGVSGKFTEPKVPGISVPFLKKSKALAKDLTISPEVKLTAAGSGTSFGKTMEKTITREQIPVTLPKDIGDVQIERQYYPPTNVVGRVSFQGTRTTGGITPITIGKIIDFPVDVSKTRAIDLGKTTTRERKGIFPIGFPVLKIIDDTGSKLKVTPAITPALALKQQTRQVFPPYRPNFPRVKTTTEITPPTETTNYLGRKPGKTVFRKPKAFKIFSFKTKASKRGPILPLADWLSKTQTEFATGRPATHLAATPKNIARFERALRAGSLRFPTAEMARGFRKRKGKGLNMRLF